MLTVAWLAAAWRPVGPYPVLHLRGEQGTAKTTNGKILRRLIDPNEVELRSQPRDERDLAVSSKQNWVLGYDNVSSIPHWLSDALCRVATGGGFGTRALYTDDEEKTFDFTRPALITSIEGVIGQPDLLDRSLAVELEAIPDDRRRTEAELWAAFDAARPGILGGLLDVVAKALELLRVVAAENRPVPRMADFAVFGEAVARALGEAPGKFLDVLRAARSGADADAIEGSAAAQALVQLVRSRRTFRGTHTQLLGELNASAEPGARREPNWPRNAQTLSGLVRRIAPALRRLGIGIKHEKVGHDRTRVVTITHDPAAVAATSSAPPDGRGNPITVSNFGADDASVAATPADRPRQATLVGSAHVAGDPQVQADDRQATAPSAAQDHAGEADPPTADSADDPLHLPTDETQLAAPDSTTPSTPE